MDEQLSLPASAASVATGRRFVRDTLRRWKLASVSESVELVASELLTNAVLHAASAPRIRLSVTGKVLRVEVADESHLEPHPKQYDLEASTGRGMILVDSMSNDWGSRPTKSGKIVWCDFELDTSCAVRA